MASGESQILPGQLPFTQVTCCRYYHEWGRNRVPDSPLYKNTTFCEKILSSTFLKWENKDQSGSVPRLYTLLVTELEFKRGRPCVQSHSSDMGQAPPVFSKGISCTH